MLRWSKLPPVELEIELAKLGLTVDDLVRDGEDDPELGPIMELLASEEAKRQLVVEEFGDRGRPQPRERKPRRIFSVLTDAGLEPLVCRDPTPDWGRLPRLEDDESAAAERPRLPEAESRPPRHRPPKPLRVSAIEACVVELAKRKKAGKPPPHELTLEQIARRVNFPPTRVRQIEQLIKVGWTPLISHPDFSTNEGYVRLPSVDEARSLLRLR